MDLKKYSVSFSFGITALMLFIIYTILHWETRLSDIQTLEFMTLTIIAYVVGLAVSVIIYFLNMRSDFNLTSVALVLFSVLLYSFFGDVQFGLIALGSFLLIFAISFGLSIIIGFILLVAVF